MPGWRHIACLLMLVPGLAGAQTLSGSTEWTVARGADQSDDQTSVNNSFWQNYTVGFDSFVVDPRLLKYNAGVSFRTNHLSFGSDQDAHQGGQRGVGYDVSASLFPSRPFPLSVQMSRNSVAESGEVPSSSVIRGGIVVPPGQPLPDFRTRGNSLSVNWQLKTEGLPHVDLGYRQGDSLVSGGGYEAEQRNGDLHAIVSKDTPGTRQTFRYQKTSFEHVLAQTFNQHFNELDYELGAMVGRRSRFVAHAGRRGSFSLFDAPPQIVDAGTGVAVPAPQGKSDTAYAISGITFEPNARVSLGLTANIDEQRTAAITTTSELATATARVEPLPGLSASASGIYGTRGQIVGDVPVTVLTRTAQVGSSYHAGVRWLEGSVAVTRGMGENSAVDGRLGEVQSWSGDTSVSASARGVSATAGYERLHSEDGILDLGNYDVRRVRGSLQVSRPRFSLNGSWDQSASDRGQGATFVHALQETYSASLSLRLGRDSALGASGGGFDSRTTLGRDRTYFGGATFESRRGRVLMSAALREELTSASTTHLEQWSLFGFGKAEYMRRQFTFGVEYRRSAQNLQFAQMINPAQFRGRQLNLRVSRRFGVRL